ncbi:RfaL protein [Actinobacillus porcitonsillarum]|uniref:RfaL protein n=1 Tax=Actinobacillus porcitonsillarum TaxID=189834 RepID=A0A2U8FGB2_9PAST|nr:O-antigen ligase family protein [Actinobacillus porcitonsillarum]AWI49985.1 RfaL protein [Actinobacillus porcitonsillarum]
MLSRIKANQSLILSLLIGLFFILILHFKISYSLIPILLALTGLGLLYPSIKQKNGQWDSQTKWLVGAFGAYFLLFVLSLIIHKGKANELDLASRALLALPILAVCLKTTLKHLWILYAILIAGLIAGGVALVQVFGLGLPKPFPRFMHIQAGDIVMSLAVFAFCALFYFYAKRNYTMLAISLIAGLFAMIASFLTGARGAWVGVPFVLLAIFWINRKNFSKWVAISLAFIVLISGVSAGNMIKQRVAEAQYDIQAYIDNNDGNTSLGARFDMWKSAVLGMQEKPIFGWGLQGVKGMRKQHFAEKKISQYAADFDHAHNQFLHDGSARGLLGLAALLSIFLVPLNIFRKNLSLAPTGSLANLWGVMGISHILLTMSYCLSQGFLSHTSGAMFYFVTVILFIGLQKNAINQPLVKE